MAIFRDIIIDDKSWRVSAPGPLVYFWSSISGKKSILNWYVLSKCDGFSFQLKDEEHLILDFAADVINEFEFRFADQESAKLRTDNVLSNLVEKFYQVRQKNGDFSENIFLIEDDKLKNQVFLWMLEVSN